MNLDIDQFLFFSAEGASLTSLRGQGDVMAVLMGSEVQVGLVLRRNQVFYLKT